MSFACFLVLPLFWYETKISFLFNGTRRWYSLEWVKQEHHWRVLMEERFPCISSWSTLMSEEPCSQLQRNYVGFIKFGCLEKWRWNERRHSIDSIQGKRALFFSPFNDETFDRTWIESKRDHWRNPTSWTSSVRTSSDLLIVLCHSHSPKWS